MTVLVTGATGAIGCRLVERLAPARRLLLPVRAAGGRSPRERLGELLTGEARGALRLGSIDVVEADVTAALPEVRDLEAVVHLAARTDFASNDADAYRPINVEACRHAARLAARARCPLVHVSTAYVAGDVSGTFREDQRDLGQAHRNAYERTKWEAEGLLLELARAHGFPLTIVRPGIVLPERPRAGQATGPGPLVYLELLAGLEGRPSEHGAVRTLRYEGDPEGRLDLVPVELVVRALVAAVDRPPRGAATYHATAGRAFTIGEIEDAVNAGLHGVRARACTELSDPDPFERRLARRAAPYRPYMALDLDFDRRGLERELLPDVADGADSAWLARVFAAHLETWRAARQRGEHAEYAPADPAAEAVRAYFARFLPRHAGRLLVPGLASLDADLAVRVPGAGAWRLTLRAGRLVQVGSPVAGAAPPPFEFAVDAAGLLEIAAGRARPSELFFARRVTVTGDLYHALATATALEEFFALYPYDGAPALEQTA